VKKTVSYKPTLRKIVLYILLFCFFLATFASCHGFTNNIQSESSDATESGVSAADSNPASQAAEAISEAQKIFLKKMAAGEINTYLTDGNWNNELMSLAKWFYSNISEKNDSDITGNYNTFKLNVEYNDVELYYVSYRLNNTEKEQYITILLGKKDGSNQYFLIDGQLSDTDNYYSIKDSWDKVKNHAVFGSYFGDFPEPECSEGVSELDIAALIGKNREIHAAAKTSKNSIAILSSALSYYENRQIDYTDWKIDFIDIQTGSAISHKLKDLDESRKTTIYLPGNPVYGGYITLIIYDNNSNGVVKDVIEYKAKLNTDSNDEDRYVKYTSEEWREKTNYGQIIQSESGRYVNFYKDNDLYLHDNVTGKDTLIYDAYFPEEIEFPKDAHKATPTYFIGDTLYFDIIGYEHCKGSGSYDPATSKLTIYKNGITGDLHSNGYVYGQKVFENNLYRFHADSPDNVETLIDSSEYLSTYRFSPNYVFQIILSTPFDYNNSINTVKIYTSADFKEVKSYNLLLPFSWLSDWIVVLDDYIFILTDSTVYDNKAYVIKLS
jgi:hypothetical protein